MFIFLWKKNFYYLLLGHLCNCNWKMDDIVHLKYHIILNILICTALADLSMYWILTRTALNLVMRYWILTMTGLNLVIRYWILTRTGLNLVMRYWILKRTGLNLVMRYWILTRTGLNLVMRYWITILDMCEHINWTGLSLVVMSTSRLSYCHKTYDVKLAWFHNHDTPYSV